MRASVVNAQSSSVRGKVCRYKYLPCQCQKRSAICLRTCTPLLHHAATVLPIIDIATLWVNSRLFHTAATATWPMTRTSMIGRAAAVSSQVAQVLQRARFLQHSSGSSGQGTTRAGVATGIHTVSRATWPACWPSRAFPNAFNLLYM